MHRGVNNYCIQWNPSTRPPLGNEIFVLNRGVALLKEHNLEHNKVSYGISVPSGYYLTSKLIK